MNRNHKRERNRNEQLTRNYEKRRLKEKIATHIKTTMIGALSSFEDYFGDMWAGEKEYEDLTEQEKEINDLWEEVRTEILDKGNHQIRLALEELDRHDISVQRHHLDLVVKNRS